jgi:SAM-dependent methyltransferase
MESTRGTRTRNAFDAVAVPYDAWYDSAEGQAIFELELDCLRPLIAGAPHPWLEIGVGTGRFAHALGVDEGLDPSRPMLEIAAARGIRVCVGVGEALPYADEAFGGVLLVTTLCFLAQPEAVFTEAARVLRPGGYLVIGFIPADSPWGKEYARKGREGHPIYRDARFYESAAVLAMARTAGFHLEAARSALLAPPSASLVDQRVREGILPGAGFVAVAFRRDARERAGT